MRKCLQEAQKLLGPFQRLFHYSNTTLCLSYSIETTFNPRKVRIKLSLFTRSHFNGTASYLNYHSSCALRTMQ